MSNLLDEFKAVQKGIKPDSNLVIPLMTWFSSKHGNIESMQDINRMFFTTNKEILAVKLALNISMKGFMPFPKKPKDEYPEFYINDLATYFDTTSVELFKTLENDDFEHYKEPISLAFAYDDKQRKLLKLKKRGIAHARKR